MQHHNSHLKTRIVRTSENKMFNFRVSTEMDGTIAPKSLTGMAEKTINKQRTITMDPICSRNRIVSCVLWKIQ